MKKTLITLAMCQVFGFAMAQHMTQGVLNLKRKFTPLIGTSSSVMNMTLRKEFDIGGRDTSYSFVVSVTETEKEVQSVSMGFSAFSVGSLLGSGSSAGVNMTYDKKNGQVQMQKPEFLKFYKCVNDVYKATASVAMFRSSPNTLCTCEEGGVQFGGEFLPGSIGADEKYYFRLGDAVFSMFKTDFEEIVKFVREAKIYFEGRA